MSVDKKPTQYNDHSDPIICSHWARKWAQ